MTQHPDPITTIQHLQQQVSDHKKWQEQADMLMDMMVKEIKQMRVTLRRIAPPT